MHDQFGQLEIVESDFDPHPSVALHNEESTDNDVYTAKTEIKRTRRTWRYFPGQEHARQ